MEKKFVDGLFVKRHEKAPDFVKANLSFNQKFIDWLQNNLNAKGYCNVDIKESKGGKLYAELNSWQPDLPPKTEEDIIKEMQEQEEGGVKVEQIPF